VTVDTHPTIAMTTKLTRQKTGLSDPPICANSPISAPIAPEVTDEYVASFAGHMQIHNNQVGHVRRRGIERAGYAECRADGVTLVGKRLGNEIDNWLIVVHNQDGTCGRFSGRALGRRDHRIILRGKDMRRQDERRWIERQRYIISANSGF